MKNKYKIAAALGLCASALSIGTIWLDSELLDQESHIQRIMEKTRKNRRSARYPIGDEYSNIRLGEALRNPEMLDSIDTNISREWDFSFDEWNYVPFENFDPGLSNSPPNHLDIYIETRMREDYTLQLSQADIRYLETIPKLTGNTPKETIENVRDYILKRRNRNGTRSTRPQPIRETLEEDGNCLDYATAFVHIAEYNENRNHHLHFVPVYLYRNSPEGIVGHAVVFLMDTEKREFSVLRIYYDKPIDTAIVRISKKL